MKKQTRHRRQCRHPRRRKENDLLPVAFKDRLKPWLATMVHHHRQPIVQEVFILYRPVQMAHRKFASFHPNHETNKQKTRPTDGPKRFLPKNKNETNTQPQLLLKVKRYAYRAHQSKCLCNAQINANSWTFNTK